MHKVLVTGGRGFIGTKLVSRLRNLSLDVIEISSDFGDIAKSETWNSFQNLDVVFHLAGRNFVPESWNEPAEFFQTNVIGTEMALECCRRHGAKLIYISSYLYGVPKKIPIKETDKIKPNNPYALSKHLAEQICEFYATYWNIPITVIRPFNVFGPGQRSEFLIPKIINQIRNNSEVRVMDLEPKRDYIYVEDLVDALIKAIKIDDGYNIFNIGSGKSYSVGEIIRIIQEKAGTNLPVQSENISRDHEIYDIKADVTFAKK